MRAEQIIFTILKINENISMADYCNKFWVGYYGAMTEDSHAEIIAWELPYPQPTREEIEAKWEEVKDSYVNPLLSEKYSIPLSDFRARFTKEEMIKIKTSTRDDIEVSIAYDDLNAMSLVDLKSNVISDILDLFVSKKLILKSRKKDLLIPILA